jgi:hypothetical protein
MRTRITIQIEAGLLRQVARLAAKQGLSVKSFLIAHLQKIVREDNAYDFARERALARLCKGMDLGWTPLRLRGELYDR